MSKPTITLDSKATITGLTKEQSNAIMTDLTIANPAFSKAQNIGVTPFGIPRDFKYYMKNEKSLQVPIGYIANIHKHINSKNTDIIDNRKTYRNEKYFNKHKLKEHLQLRDYQTEIVTTCLNKTIGIVEAMTGSGKSLAYIDLILKRKEPTLILVHTIELANQTIQNLVNHTTITKDEIGFIGAGKFYLKNISVGLLQTVTRLTDDKLQKINNMFGQIICDEVQLSY